jgi:hypothetical protein
MCKHLAFVATHRCRYIRLREGRHGSSQLSAKAVENTQVLYYYKQHGAS